MPTVLNPNAAPDEPLEIQLDDESPSGSGSATTPPSQPSSAPGGTGSTEPAVGIEDLKRQLDESAREREAMVAHNRRLQQERDYAAAVAQEAQARGITADEVVNDTNLNAAQEQMTALVAAQKAAYENGEWGSVAEINGKMGRLGGMIAQLEGRKEWLANNREQWVARQQQAAQAAKMQQEQGPADPVERLLASKTERTRDYLRQHKELIRSDGTLKSIAIDAHNYALDNDARVDTDAYFSKIDEYIASKGAVSRNEPPRPSPNRQEERTREVRDTSARMAAPMAAAPVSRGTGNAGGGQVVRLTAEMRKAAEEQGIDPAEWYEGYRRLVAEGRMEPWK